MKKLILIYH